MVEDLEQQVRESLSIKDKRIQTGRVIWPKEWEGPHSDQQQRSLMARLLESELGLVVDCSGVEVGNSDVVTLLLAIQDSAAKMQKQFVLYDVPDALKKMLRICDLQSAFLTAKDEDAARRIILNEVDGDDDGRSKWWWLTPWRPR